MRTLGCYLSSSSKSEIAVKVKFYCAPVLYRTSENSVMAKFAEFLF
jgi:hypothetical protein